MDANLLQQFSPAKKPLLDLIFQRVDGSMLQEIAKADYGYEAEEHLKELEAIKRGYVPVPMKWHPGEVLELIRWSEPEDERWSPGSVGERGHWMRLFSCTILILASAEPGNADRLCGEDSTTIQFVDSALKLGPGTSLMALQFLCWRITADTPDQWFDPYFSLGILLLSVSLGKCDRPTARILMATIHSVEQEYGTLLKYGTKADAWRRVIWQVLIDPDHPNRERRKFGEYLLRLIENS